MSKNNWDRTVFATVQQTLSEQLQLLNLWIISSQSWSTERWCTEYVQLGKGLDCRQFSSFSDWNRCSSKTCIRHVETFADVEAARSIVNNMIRDQRGNGHTVHLNFVLVGQTPVFVDHVHICHLWWSFNFVDDSMNCVHRLLKVSWAHAVTEPVFKVTWSCR